MRLKIVILLFLSIACVAQQNLWKPITIADGLSQGMVNDIVQDRQGFMWVATKDGLNRYDGYNFKIFTHNPYKEYSISGNNCTRLLEDSKGRIWVSTENDGLNLFDPLTQKFYHANPRIANNERNFVIFYLKEDTAGNIWVITDNPEKSFFITQKGYPAQADFSNWLIEADFASRQKTSFRYDVHSMSLQIAKSFSIKNHFPSSFDAKIDLEAYKVLEDKQKRYWVAGQTAIHCIVNNKIIKTIPFPTSVLGITVLNQFDDETLTICNQEYLWLIKPDKLIKTAQLTPANAFATMPRLLEGMRQFFKDKSDNIWAGTFGYGLFRFNKNVKQFQSFLAGYSPSHLLQDKQGRLYIHGNYRPKYRYYQVDKARNTISPIPHSIDHPTYVDNLLMQDSRNNFYLIYTINGKRVMAYFSTDWQKLKEYELPPVYVFGGGVYSYKMLEDKDGNIWLGVTDGNLIKFNPETETFQVFNYQHLLPENSLTVETFSIYQDHKDIIWIGTQKGLIKAEGLSGKPRYTIYKNNKTDGQSLSNDFVSAIVSDPNQPDKYLWVSTKGGGLERLDKQSGKFEHFTEEQGLPNKVVYGILVGNDTNLWLSTNRGLSRFTPKTAAFTNFNKSDGLQDDEFNTNSYFKAPTGELFFGGINGINIFKASDINHSKDIPVIKIFGLKINNKPIEVNDKAAVLEKPIEYIRKLEVAHEQNQISLEFGVMDFTNPVKNRYRYQLVGLDDDWVEAGTDHFANYVQIPSGTYTFRVMGTVNGEVWSKPIELIIRVNPPFYRTWWAYLIYLTLFTYTVYRLYKNQLKRVRLQEQLIYKDKEAERLAELDSLKTRFFANISHEFRTPLTLLAGPLSDLKKKYPQEGIVHVMQRNLSRLQTLINQLLDLSKLEAGKMAPKIQQADLAGFLKQLLASFDSLAESKDISFVYDKNDTRQIAYFDSDKIEKIITNLLSNAFKFTPEGGKIAIQTTYTDTSFTIQVQDSGIGIEQERLTSIFDRFYQVEDSASLKSYTRNYEGTGIGLALVKELVDVLQGQINVESQISVGTTFTVSIPTDKATWGKYLNKEALLTEPNVGKIERSDSGYLTSNLTNNESIQHDSELPILLIIEDNTDLRAYIRSHFELSYQIVEAADGQEGYEKAVELIPDLVICDLMMPRLDGFGFCKLVKSDMRTNHIPVIMLTARAALEDRLEGLELGADDYLAKPFNTDELQIRVRNLIFIRQALQQKYSQSVYQEPLSYEPKEDSLNDQFLQQLHAIIDKNLINTDFSVNILADEMNITPSQLRRKLKAITDQTIIEFIRNYRLQKAAKMLQNKYITVSEVAYQVGFESISYFAKVFQEVYGKTPSEWSN
ncbi:two-component regulator propeller domain-containing protein [Emticicia sp. C21]|uniref:hybrid sensor histidine kinase/response regulator transcription factor n=1 Tax=Emticicia sp. C21 TaxID=2302915 RepID=UPI000E35364D|nr:two-component regulator propeller domain-containing protein [Emticicia sp. C21]RFS18436.1 response regulator [Emticicia sp. C21]